MIFKNVIKKILHLTPYDVIRRNRRGTVVGDESYDAIEHNSLNGINSIFSNKSILKNYVDEERERQYLEVINIIRENTPGIQPLSFGDVGCGPGDLLRLMRRAFPTATFSGYDFADATLAAARVRCPEAEYLQHDIYAPLPYQHAIVTCTQTLEHLLYPERAMENLIGATLPGGLIVVTVPDGRIDQYRGHINFWSPESWKVWITKQASRHEVATKRLPKKVHGANLLAVIQISTN